MAIIQFYEISGEIDICYRKKNTTLRQRYPIQNVFLCTNAVECGHKMQK